MYSFISPAGQTIRTKTVKKFAESFGFNYSYARDLACGRTQVARGWCSTSPKAKRKRDRFLTKLVNLRSGETSMIGKSLAQFSRDHHLCRASLSELLNGRVLHYRDFVLAKSLALAGGLSPAGKFQN